MVLLSTNSLVFLLILSLSASLTSCFRSEGYIVDAEPNPAMVSVGNKETTGSGTSSDPYIVTVRTNGQARFVPITISDSHTLECKLPAGFSLAGPV